MSDSHNRDPYYEAQKRQHNNIQRGLERKKEINDDSVKVYVKTSDGKGSRESWSTEEYKEHLEEKGVTSPKKIKDYYTKIDEHEEGYKRKNGSKGRFTPGAIYGQRINAFATKEESKEEEPKKPSVTKTTFYQDVKSFLSYVTEPIKEGKKIVHDSFLKKEESTKGDQKAIFVDEPQSTPKSANTQKEKSANTQKDDTILKKIKSLLTSIKIDIQSKWAAYFKSRRRKANDEREKAKLGQVTSPEPMKHDLEGDFNQIINKLNRSDDQNTIRFNINDIRKRYTFYDENRTAIIEKTLEKLKKRYQEEEAVTTCYDEKNNSLPKEEKTVTTYYDKQNNLLSKEDSDRIKEAKLSKIKTAINELNDPESTFRQRYKDTLGRKIFDEKLHEKINSKARSAEAAEAYTESESSAANTPIAKGNLSPKAVVASAKPAPRSFPDDAESTLPAKNNETIVRGHFQLSSVKQRQQPSKKIPSTSPQRSAAQRLLPPHFSRQQ